jgi:transcriptional regulator with XRE-family HTH domain
MDNVSLSLGERIRDLRHGWSPKMSQSDLAEKAGVSVDLIRKLEQGRKQTALIGTLHKIARALDVELPELLGGVPRLDRVDDDGAGVLAIRRALTISDELLGVDGGDDEPPTAAELRKALDHAWGAYWHGRYDVLAKGLPALIASGRMLARDQPAHVQPRVQGMLAEAYQVATFLLVQLERFDLAYIALERATAAADESDDRLLRASMAGAHSWLLLEQGRWSEAQHMARRQAELIEPRIGVAAPEELSVWGSLLLDCATAAGRGNRTDEADDLLNLAETAATRMGAERNDYQTAFGLAQVIMQSVDVAVVSGRPGRALALAQRMPPDNRLPLAAKARHSADIAYAHCALGRDAAAVDTLLSTERLAPNWIRYQAYPRTIVRELRERRGTPKLRGLAHRLGVA